jgi:hypothetical protein
MKPDAGSGARHHDHLRTSCGRDLTIGRLALGDAVHPAGRVFIDLGECPDCAGSAWAGLSVAEARRLAAALLAQAAAAEQASCRYAQPWSLELVELRLGEDLNVRAREQIGPGNDRSQRVRANDEVLFAHPVSGHRRAADVKRGSRSSRIKMDSCGRGHPTWFFSTRSTIAVKIPPASPDSLGR